MIDNIITMKSFINQNKKILSFTLMLLLIVSTLTLSYFDKFLKTPVAPKGIVSFELGQTLPKSQAIMASWDEQAKTFAGLSLGFDFLYIPVYTGFLALLLFFSIEKLTKNELLHKTGKTLIYLIFLAGLLDVIENIALIKLLTGEQQALLSMIAYLAASVKFLIIASVILFLIISWAYRYFRKKKKTSL